MIYFSSDQATKTQAATLICSGFNHEIELFQKLKCNSQILIQLIRYLLIGALALMRTVKQVHFLYFCDGIDSFQFGKVAE
jgi:hypothetical protein